jgi:hypothetical protein
MVHIRRIDESTTTSDIAEHFNREYPEIAIERGDSSWNRYRENIERRLANYHGGTKDASGELENVGKSLRRKIRINISEDLLVWLANMTSENYHVEARYEIARYLSQFSDDMRQFEVYYRSFVEAFCNGGWNFPNDSEPRRIMDDMMFITIGKIFGAEVVRKLSCAL